MKKIITKLRLPIIWLIVTLLLYILLAATVMFSRQITLDGVRAFDFDLVSQSLTTFDEKTLDKDFKYLADTLTLDKGKTIFFPLALLYKNKCIENGSRLDSLCSKYSNIDSFKTATKNIEPVNAFNKQRYHFDNGDTYFYKNFGDYALIGQAGQYKYINNIEALSMFIKNDLSRYFSLDGEPGKYGNLAKTWEKTNGIFLIVLFTSLFLALLQWGYFKKQSKKYKKLKDENKLLNNEWNVLNSEYQQSLEVLKRKEYDLSNKEKHLKLLGVDDSQMEELIDLKEEINKLTYDKNLKLKAIKMLEKKEAYIDKSSVKQLKKLSSHEKHEISSNLANELIQVKQLWRRETSWNERREIEKRITKEISEKSGLNIPFTATQAFIAFEENVVRMQVKEIPDVDPNNTLGENVHLLIENKLIPWNQEKKYRDIVVARNDWFHYGKIPTLAVMYHLLSILENNESEALL